MTLLPPNATDLERSLDSMSAQIGTLDIPIRDLWNSETCQTPLLPWLAWAYSVDEWSIEWSESQKRQSIKNSANVHKHKGTVGAIQDSLASIGIELSVLQWFDRVPVGDPYTFEIVIDAKESPVTKSSMESIVRIVGSTKNARSQLAKTHTQATSSSTLHIASATCVGVESTVLQDYGVDTVHLLTEGALFGFDEVETAVDELYQLLHGMLPFAWLIKDFSEGTVDIEITVDDLNLLLHEIMPAPKFW
ncbi:MAG: phage tail protein I [Alcaligenaceae bacterium]|nr:phage tail protein I [Alcaligenaceae bacterium]